MLVHEPRNEEYCETKTVFLTSQGINGILDADATKSVVGSNLLVSLIESLDPKVRKHIYRIQCNIIFKFGNQGTLDSHQALEFHYIHWFRTENRHYQRQRSTFAF